MKFLFAIGVSFLTLGLASYFGLPLLIDKYINAEIALKPNSQSYPMWRELPVPLYQKFYFYNVTNAADIEQFGAKPRLDEVGPFTYRMFVSKEAIEVDDIDATIRFKQLKRWQFEPSLSIADHRLQLVTLNTPLAITLSLIQSAAPAIRYIVTFSLDGLSEGFFTKRTVKQLLFDGYPDLLTTFGPLLNAEMLSQGGHFGYMNARNNSLDGTFEVHTGVKNISNLNTIASYNKRERLSFWGSSGECNSLEGATTGEMFPPMSTTVDEASGSNTLDKYRQSNAQLRLFQSDFCRAWPLNIESAREDKSTGLTILRFVASRDVLRNSTDLPENACFFPHKHRHQISLTPASAPHSGGSGGAQPLPSSPSPASSSAARQAGGVALPVSPSSSSPHPSLPPLLPVPLGASPGTPAEALMSTARQLWLTRPSSLLAGFGQPSPETNTVGGGASSLYSATAAQHAAQQQQQPPPLSSNARPAATGAASGGAYRSRVRVEWPAGVFSLAPCKFNAPIYMSMPHFLDADEWYLSQVRGLAPRRDAHEFFVDLEPRTGTPLNVAARVQLNVAISKPQGLVRFKNVPDIMFPVFWQELYVNVSGPVVDQLVLAARKPAEATLLISYIFLYAGALVLILTSVFYIHKNYYHES